MPTFRQSREVVTAVLRGYSQMPVVSRVIVIEFEGGDEAPRSKDWRVVRYPDDLRLRFDPVLDPGLVHTDYVLITDDDVLVGEKYLKALVGAARRFPGHFHGLAGRRFTAGGRYVPFLRVPGGIDWVTDGVDVDMVLTSSLLARTQTLARAVRAFREDPTLYNAAKRLNGEDIAVNIIHGHVKWWPWSAAQPLFPLRARMGSYAQVGNTSISRKPGHLAELTQVIRTLRRVLDQRAQRRSGGGSGAGGGLGFKDDEVAGDGKAFADKGGAGDA